jgi:hypothetical protein
MEASVVSSRRWAKAYWLQTALFAGYLVWMLVFYRRSRGDDSVV